MARFVFSDRDLGPKEVAVRARLRIKRLSGSGATFVIGKSHFGFEGRSGVMFVEGPLFGGKVKIIGKSVVSEGRPFEFEVRCQGQQLSFWIDGRQVFETPIGDRPLGRIGFRPHRATMQILEWSIVSSAAKPAGPKSAGDLVVESDFEEPAGIRKVWSIVPPNASSRASVIPIGVLGTSHSLKINPSAQHREVAFTAPFAEPQDEVMVEFYLAISAGQQSDLTISTMHNEASEAGQVNLSYIGGRLLQRDGTARRLQLVSRSITPTVDPGEPKWHRMRIIAGREQPTIDVWVSKAGSEVLPFEPTATVNACKTDVPLTALQFKVRLPRSKSNTEPYVLIDQVEVTSEDGIPLSYSAKGKDIPESMRRLIDAGNVTLVYRTTEEAPELWKNAHAVWHFTIGHRCAYRITKKRALNGWNVTIQPNFKRITQSLSHEVILPIRYDVDHWWQTQLARHEFDHVAIASDPRVRILAKYLIRNMPPIQRTLPREVEPTAEVANAIINDEVDKCRQALNALLKKNNESLDRISQHGKVRIDDRRAFFTRMYRKENLLEMGFPYVREVLGLVDSRQYADVRLLYNYEPNF